MENVGHIKEETITDFLVWKWGELDKRFNYIHVTPFDHFEENTTTGADFDLELWLVGRTHHLSLAVQAKKFIKRNDSYVQRLKYPNGSKAQMNTLLAYAKSNNRLPFYFIYTIPEASTKTMCRGFNLSQGGIFMADAKKMKEYADGIHGKRISRDKLLKEANPFHCLFCCPLVKVNFKAYVSQYFPTLSSEEIPDNNALPDYVKKLLNSRDGASETKPNENELPEKVKSFRFVGVYDMRDES